MRKMRQSQTKNISEVLRQSGLSRLVQRANTLNSLNERIQRKLPEAFRQRCRVVNFCENKMIFETQSAVVRQSLSLQQSDLLRVVQQELPEINELQFRINPDFNPR